MLHKRLLCVDEMSLLTTEVLARLGQVLSVVRTNEEVLDSTTPFGGLSQLLIGDFHQFPPVAQLKKALFYDNPTSALAQIGRHLFCQFKTVILLKQQMRIKDETWQNILARARYGLCTAEDLDIIRQLVLTDPRCSIPDFNVPPWNDAVLVTPRNSVRTEWNNAAVRSHCKVHGEALYISPAEDSVQGNQLTNAQQRLVSHLPTESTGHLSTTTSIAIGMKVMITENIATVANIANGSRGIITSIMLDPHEIDSVTFEDDGVHTIKLNFPPCFIIVKLDFTELKQLPLLQENEIPLSPSTRKFRVGKKPSVTVNRRQLALTPAYAFTDFKAQGQTLEKVIVDIGKTVNFSLTPFNAYVALSRSKGRDDIRLLRDFEDKLFTRAPSDDLKREDERLQELAEKTQRDYYAGRYGPPHHT